MNLLKEEIIKLYLSGIGSDSIAKQLNISANCVLKLLKRNNIKTRELRKLSLEDEQTICKLYLDGYSLTKIAELINTSRATVKKYIIKNNITYSKYKYRKHKIHEDFFDVIDSEEKAYILGFLFADGCNMRNFVKIDLNIKDVDILRKIESNIFIDGDHIKYIKRTRNEKQLSHCYLTISSKYICEKLNNLGCCPRKSLILTFPNWLTNPILQKHFIRGYYDGDGGVHIPKTRSSSVKIVSTLEMCESIKQILLDQINFDTNKISHIGEKNVHTINFCGNRKVETFLNWLYDEATIYLDRKYNLYLQLLEKNR